MEEVGGKVAPEAPSPPQPTMSWLDQAAADAMTEIERIYTDARAAMEKTVSTNQPVVRVPIQAGPPE